MTPERWRRMKELLAPVLELDPGKRADYLDQACGNDAELRMDLERLLDAGEQAGTHFLSHPAVLREFILDFPQLVETWIGRRIGSYELVEEIGVGGMGEVYRAVRADDEYRKEVAIKLVRSGQDSGFVLHRFKNERQILAGLDHPNIARLLDGGTTEQGLPYFVMEFIEGQRIDEYCDAQKLATTERLKLFLPVCSAVQYAHQRLIIHRDIKPGNILVTPEGVPKLLDFGIAKILLSSETASQPEQTISLFRLLTPEYASPEQVKSEPITTASDVYSLGVVLYELLTGRTPYCVATRTPHEISRAVCEADPEKPSAAVRHTLVPADDREQKKLAGAAALSAVRGSSPEKLSKRLGGDLDNIVLMALRKEPQRRYVSVEQFAQDIRRHLGHLPVIAHKDTFAYRASKFITRHKAGVAATGLVLIALLAGFTATIREARIAEANRQRAEKRFNDVRRIANSLMFEVHDSIENLPGATPARKLIVQESLEYLDSLSRQSAGNLSLQRELATAYEKVGRVQGTTNASNLGEPTAALESFRKALVIRQAVAIAQPNVEDQIALARAYRRIGQLRWFSFSDTEQGLENLREAVRIAEAAAGKGGENPQALVEELATDYEQLGDIQEGNGVRGSASDLHGALENHRRALALLKKIAEANPSVLASQRAFAMANLGVGDDLVKASDREQALNYFRRAREIMEPLARTNDDALLRQSLAACFTRIGDALLMNGRATEALKYYREESNLLEPMAAADPKDVFLRSYFITSKGDIGHALVEAGHLKQGLSLLMHALAEQTVLANSDNDSHSRSLLAITEISVGEAFEHTGNVRRAQESYSRALNIYSAISAADPKDIEDTVNEACTRNHLGRAHLKSGNSDQASEEYRKALSISKALATSNPDNVEALYALADSYAGLGDVSAVLARRTRVAKDEADRWRESGDWYQKSLSTWQKIPNPAHISPNFFEVTEPREIARRAKLAADQSRIRNR